MDQQPKVVPQFPPEAMPTIFADGVANVAQSGEVAKFYLLRTDPSINTPNDNRPQVVGQVVMSMSGFLDAAAFFEAIVKNYVEKGIVSREKVDEARTQAGLPPG